MSDLTRCYIPIYKTISLPIKKIALFGATGQTGAHVLQKALQQGYTVNALVRTPSKLIVQSKDLNVIEGDVLKPEDVKKTIEGCDLVISVFGHVKVSPEWLQRDGTQDLVQAM